MVHLGFAGGIPMYFFTQAVTWAFFQNYGYVLPGVSKRAGGANE